MKSILSDKCCKKEEKPFPKLMKGSTSGSVYLMTSNSEGTVVHCVPHSGTSSLGTFVHDIGGCSDYEGDVCLTND